MQSHCPTRDLYIVLTTTYMLFVPFSQWKRDNKVSAQDFMLLKTDKIPLENNSRCGLTNISCHGLLKNFHAPAGDRTGDPSIYSQALYHVAIKAGLYRKAVQVYYIPNLYPVTFSPSILNSSSNSQEYKNHLR